MRKITEKFHFIDLRDDGALMTSEKHVAIQTFRDHHPDAEIVLWTYDKIADEGHTVPAQFYAETDRRAQADILRYWILATFGGVYCDTDVICLANWDSWARGVECFVAQFEEQRVGVTNAVLGALPKATLFDDYLALLPGLVFAYEDAPFVARTGSAVLFKMLGKGTYDAGTAHPVTLPDPNLLCAYKMSDAVKGATPNLKQLAAGGSLAVHLWGSSMSDDKRALVGQRQMNVLGYSSLVYGEPIASLPARDGE